MVGKTSISIDGKTHPVMDHVIDYLKNFGEGDRVSYTIKEGKVSFLKKDDGQFGGKKPFAQKPAGNSGQSYARAAPFKADRTKLAVSIWTNSVNAAVAMTSEILIKQKGSKDTDFPTLIDDMVQAADKIFAAGMFAIRSQDAVEEAIDDGNKDQGSVESEE